MKSILLALILSKVICQAYITAHGNSLIPIVVMVVDSEHNTTIKGAKIHLLNNGEYKNFTIDSKKAIDNKIIKSLGEPVVSDEHGIAVVFCNAKFSENLNEKLYTIFIEGVLSVTYKEKSKKIRLKGLSVKKLEVSQGNLTKFYIVRL